MTGSEKKTGQGGFLQNALGAIVGPFEPLLRLGLGAVIKWVLLQGPMRYAHLQLFSCSCSS
jgi:hypothetical protein